MSEIEHHTLSLTDANILIDYASFGMEVLALVSEYLTPVVVPDVILQEVRRLAQTWAGMLRVRREIGARQG